MIFSKLNYAWAAICSLLLSCASSMKTLVLPQGMDNSFRSGEIDHPFLQAGKVYVLEYRVISDSLIQSASYDTTLTFGLIIPRSSLVFRVTENKMVFGTDSMQCSIRYETMQLYRESEQNSLLTDIILNPQKNVPDYDRYQKNARPYKKMLVGAIQYPLLNEQVYFKFEHQMAEKDFDSAQISGYLRSGNDSFFIIPLYKAETLRGKNVRPMQVLQGYCLMKGDSVYAFLQHAPMVKTLYKGGLKDVLYLNKKSTLEEQLMVAAYFSLVSRLVFTTTNEVLY